MLEGEKGPDDKVLETLPINKCLLLRLNISHTNCSEGSEGGIPLYSFKNTNQITPEGNNIKIN